MTLQRRSRRHDSRLPIVPPLKWHGGKQYLASRIVALLPPHLHYVEPFAGGLALLLAKDPEGVSEVVNDLNGDLTNFWKVLSRVEDFDRFLRIVQATPFSEAVWREAAEAKKLAANEPDPVQRAYDFFILCRQSLAGRMDAFAPLSKTRTRRGMNEQASAWLTVVDGLPAVHARLKRVVVFNSPALKVIKREDGVDTLFYLDPPYLHETRVTTLEYGDQEMSGADHEKLLEALTRIEGKFLLSGYHSGLYDDLATRFGWNVFEFELPNNAAGGGAKRRMVECVWSNFTPSKKKAVSPGLLPL